MMRHGLNRVVITRALGVNLQFLLIIAATLSRTAPTTRFQK
jgi:hypothetical protein